MEFENHFPFLGNKSLYEGSTRKMKGHRKIGCIEIFLVFCLLSAGCRSETNPTSTDGSVFISDFEQAKITAFCGDCHAMPSANSFPKRAWHDEVKRGYAFYYAANRTDLDVPVQEITLKYFTSLAPDTLPIRKPGGIDSEWLARFNQIPISIPDTASPATSFVDFVDLGPDLGEGLILSDMRGGGIYFSRFVNQEFITPTLLGRAKNPAVVRVFDWDRDGLLDLLVADLGSFLPADHAEGKVIWMQQKPEAIGTFEPITLIGGLGRVASIEVGDLNGDGLADLAVAEFGWQSTGSVFWIAGHDDPTNMSTKHVIDERSGAIHIPLVDLNGDGNLDLVALISQHHECIEAFLNDGQGSFERRTIYEAPDPSYGSSGMELVDLNGNGRLDVLYTNGDSFDSFFLKPTHSVRWFENTDAFPFREHMVGEMPGAHRALALDLNGDGISEIVSGAFLPKKLLRTHSVSEAEGLVLWTRNSHGTFDRHVLVQTETSYAALCVAKPSNAARPFIVVGHFREEDSGPAITLWIPVGE